MLLHIVCTFFRFTFFFCSFLRKDSIVHCVHNFAFAQYVHFFSLSMEAMENSEHEKTKKKREMKCVRNQFDTVRDLRPWISFNSCFLFGFLSFVLHHLRYLIYMTWRHHRSFTLAFNLTEKFEEFLFFLAF